MTGDAEPVAVPSGAEMSLIDVIQNEPGPEGVVVRFRFLAPGIARAGGTVPFEAAVADMAFLCQTYALPRVIDNTPIPTQIIISLADRIVPFGEASPEATQFFEAYRIEEGACIWDAY